MLFGKQALDFSDRARDYRRAAQASSFLAVEQAQSELWDKSLEHLKRAFENTQRIKEDRTSYSELLVLSRAGQVASMRGDTEKAVEY